MIPCIAGITNAVDAPFTTARMASRGTVAVPENSRAAMVETDRMSMT
jgi:hypothetical protein